MSECPTISALVFSDTAITVHPNVRYLNIGDDIAGVAVLSLVALPDQHVDQVETLRARGRVYISG
jgi:hypothetical protein